MDRERPLKLKLYVVESSAYRGPIELNVYGHHKPRLLTTTPQAFGAEPGMYLVFRAKYEDFIDLDTAYDQMGVLGGETLILTQMHDIETVKLLSKLIKRGETETGHTIILVHGIRTHAAWFDEARQVFSKIEGVIIRPIKYGRFDLLRFIIPGPWRRGPLDKTEKRLLPIISDAMRDGHKVTVIAHSNGTNVVAQILKENKLVVIDNLIMCGSIIDAAYDWNAVVGQIKGKLVNDRGVRDVWPAVVSSLTWGFGNSGTHGFGDPVIDRVHNTDHYAYFKADFMRRHWMPIVESGTVDHPIYKDDTVPKSPWWFGFFDFPWKWTIIPGLLVTALFLFSS